MEYDDDKFAQTQTYYKLKSSLRQQGLFGLRLDLSLTSPKEPVKDRRVNMSTKYIKGNYSIVPNMGEVLKLKGATVNVYLALCKYGDEDGLCFPSYNTIAEQIDYNVRTCKRAIEELVEAGLIERRQRSRSDGSLSSNYYQLIDKGVVVSMTPPSGVDVTTLTKPINKELDKSNSLTSKKEVDPSAVSLSLLLVELIKARGGHVKTADAYRWATDVEKINRLDGFSWAEIEKVIKWCQADDFWQNNILSGSKLRKQMVQLALKMNQESGQEDDPVIRAMKREGLM